ncbi:MAG TPA: shikimate dehydrogenase [Longimicrobiales bacterium]
MPITAATRLIALLGDPVSHSLSPIFQNAAFRAAGVDGVYVALRCDAAALPGLMRGIARAGGGGNITVPHKLEAARVIERATAAVQRTGACNTFWEEEGRLCGDNTDVAGFRAALRAVLASAAGARVMVLGAGGAASAALAGLEEERAAGVTLLARSPDRAEELRRRFETGRLQIRVARGPEEIRGERFDLVVNATPLGLRPDDPLPLEPADLASAGAVLDLVYGARPTRWVEAARALGIPAADGMLMLVEQGAAAFERWWGVPAPVEAMREALAAVRSSAPATGDHRAMA